MKVKKDTFLQRLDEIKNVKVHLEAQYSRRENGGTQITGHHEYQIDDDDKDVASLLIRNEFQQLSQDLSSPDMLEGTKKPRSWERKSMT